ncbi:hypothetical protein [Neorhizobium sp. P12A]|jgi:hypothetical protein|uniref:hypothetical protein n=1 Tax=Neorhizobium sp. P12A TaxID=2268027 RepID=UPI001FED2CEF|nr:hypothetical protein [Neorhizobium sp. P12A]
MAAGPFHGLMRRLGLRKRGWRAFVFAMLCWTVPLLLVLANGGGYAAGLYLGDLGAWAKFLIAPVLLTLSEKPIEFALDACLRILFGIPLVSSQSIPAAGAAIATARTRSRMWQAELVCLIVAIAASCVNADRFLGGSGPVWAVSEDGLTSAGVWCLVISNTLYWFLLVRIVWKHLVWTGFLSTIASGHLRLVVTHPDGHGGLGFISGYLKGYAFFSLGAGSVIAGGLGHVMQREAVTPTIFTLVCAGWLVVIFLFYALPLAPLGMKIARLKRDTIMRSLTGATDFERSAERRALGVNVFPDVAEDDAEDLHDVKPLYQAALKTSALLLKPKNAVPLLLPALLPLLAVGAFFLPYAQLSTIVKRLLLL